MLRQGLACALGLALLSGMAGHADARNKNPTFIVLSGCTHFQPPVCTMLSAGGKNYALVGAPSPVPIGTGVTVTGQVMGDVGICFAPNLKVIKWTPNKLRCPK